MAHTIWPLIVDDEMSCNMIGATFGQQSNLYAILKLRIYEKFIVRASYTKCRILTQNSWERNTYVTKPYFAGLRQRHKNLNALKSAHFNNNLFSDLTEIIMVIAVYFLVSQSRTRYTQSLFTRNDESIIFVFSSLRYNQVNWKAENACMFLTQVCICSS